MGLVAMHSTWRIAVSYEQSSVQVVLHRLVAEMVSASFMDRGT